MTTLQDDMATDVPEILLDTDEFANDVLWESKNGIDSDTFPILGGDLILHGDERTGNVTEEDASVQAETINAIVIQVKINDTITIKGVIYEVVNNPFPDSFNGNLSIINIRRKHETRI